MFGCGRLVREYLFIWSPFLDLKMQVIKLTSLLVLVAACLKYSALVAAVIETDVCIYGGTAGGVAAAVQATRMGKTAVIAEFGKHLGGITSGGLSATDIGNKGAIGGISREFYQRVGKHYGTQEQWTFEPHVAENLFNEMA